MSLKLKISNVGKTLKIVLGILIWIPFILTIYYFTDYSIIKENPIIGILILIVPPCGFILIWSKSQRFNTVVGINQTGIEIESQPEIKWGELRLCSWESIRGSICIYLKLNGNKRLLISPSAGLKHYSENYEKLEKLYNQIESICKTNEKYVQIRFTKNRISNRLTWIFVVSIVSAFVALTVFNLMMK